MRSDKDLILLLQQFNTFAKTDLNSPLPEDLLFQVLDDQVGIRISNFFKRRFGHLPDDDLLKFVEMIKHERRNLHAKGKTDKKT